MSNITIYIDGNTSDLLPDGVRIEAVLNQGRASADLDFLHDTIVFAHKEAAEAKGYTSAERLLNDRLYQIEKAIINGLPAETKLDIANHAAGASKL